MQQTRQHPVGEELAAGLTARAVVRLVLGVDDALHGHRADRTGQAEAPVDRHLRPEGGDLVREAAGELAPQALDPLSERLQSGRVEAAPALVGELAGARERRETRAVQDLVRIGVADSGHQTGIGERALQGVILGRERLAKGRRLGGQRLDSPAVVGGELGLAAHQVNRSAVLLPGLGEHELAGGENAMSPSGFARRRLSPSLQAPALPGRQRGTADGRRP